MSYQVGETFKITLAIVDENNAAADPVSVLIYVRNPDRSLAVDGAAFVKTATGAYYYYNTVSSQVGTHKVKIVAAGSSGDVIETYEYEAVESFQWSIHLMQTLQTHTRITLY